MQLKQLKLAGFKSFVDPAVVPFPSQLVAVVGPNGCGKSNIIDAVRWVMGESSAKNLRGEAMTDVIFNGSSQRKPVGQASVELIFDNSLGRIGGAYAQYAEVAVKRVVTRDGDSNYYLNGSRCRRRDITDIFLGTGAGTRGYSIIGQGTISKLIEARPEELRLFLEEAAGVSKYKERRRETVQRMEQTRDNLARVEDICLELGKQLERLERQAKAAERYTDLKSQEKRIKAEILVLKWQDLSCQQQIKQNEIQGLSLAIDEAQTQQTQVESQKLIQVEQLNSLTDNNQQLQNRFYQTGTEMARLEESLQQRQREQQRLTQELTQIADELTELQQQMQQDGQSQIQWQEQLLIGEEKWQTLQTAWDAKQQSGQAMLAEKSSLDEQWQQCQTQFNQAKHQHQQQQLQYTHLQQKKQDMHLRLEKLQLEAAQHDVPVLEETVTQLQQQTAILQSQQQLDEALVSQLQTEDKQLTEAQQLANKALEAAQDAWQKIKVEHAALSAIQQSTVSQGTLNNRVTNNPLLIEQFQVAPEWRMACEILLSNRLHAVVLPEWPALPWPEPGQSLLTAVKTPPAPGQPMTLAHVVDGIIPEMNPALDSILLAADLPTAWTMLSGLETGQSVLTPDGYWLGPGWLQAPPAAPDDEEGLLARQQRISTLATRLQQAEEAVQQLKQQREQLQKSCQDKQIQLAVAKDRLSASKDACLTNANALQVKQQQFDFIIRQQQLSAQEQADLQFALEEILQQHLELETALKLAQDQHEEWEQLGLAMAEKRQIAQQQYQSFQQEAEQLREEFRQSEKLVDQIKGEVLRVQERLSHQQQRLDRLQAKQLELKTLQGQCVEPGESLQQQLSLKLAEYQTLETQLSLSREQLSQAKIQIEDIDAQVRQQQQNVRQLEDRLNGLKMQEQELAVRAASIIESMQEMAVTLQEIMAQLPAEITVTIREAELLQITEKIKRLGAINLAAIEEYAIEGERKRYLDEQHADLTAALLALEEAMQQIDNETTKRFADTFNEVNQRFQLLFPRLFGGGRAQLELTCDNLLEAGIVVMAQPPGKRYSTIHLLSGGEKAMTAVALVFAIFQLNPSPFCMLDEVDAPLDDVNVGRFCEMVKEMSQFVQFLFITHNKVTMEMADHLIGVTMREPGVSRLVAVDVQQALTME